MAAQPAVGLLVLLCCVFTVQAAQDTPYIYVRNATEAHDDPSCWFGGQDNPCKTLQFALEGIHNTSNSTYHPSVFLEGGEYELNEGGATVFNGTRNPSLTEIGIIGNVTSEIDYPSVHCKKYTGLTFINITNINLTHVKFSGCGALQRSTSKNDTVSSGDFSFAKSKVGLHFVFCKDILFLGVWVIDSPGTGVVIYASGGSNTFENSWFEYNQLPQHSEYPGGGGLYLEFPYCNPVVEDYCDEHVPPEYTSNATYIFSKCRFNRNYANVIHSSITHSTFIIPHKRDHIAFGRGGGLSVFFKGRAQYNDVTVSQCTFYNNTALWGAGIFVEFQDNSSNNKFSAYGSLILKNYCPNDIIHNEGTGGGGTRLGFLFFADGHAHNNHILFDGCKFQRNTAYWGGGVSFYTAREQGTPYATNTLQFKNCFWSVNKARLGAAIDLSVWHPVTDGSTVQVQFTNTTINFHQTLSNLQTPGSLLGIGAMYIDSIPTLFDGPADFNYNFHSAIAAISTSLNFLGSCVANFSNNQGRNGGAIALLGSAFIRTYNGTQMNFINNSADLKGGAISAHSIGEHDLISSRNCFIRFENISSSPTEWTSYFFFENNTVDGRLNSIYTTTLLPCVWGGAYGPYSPNTSTTFCWDSIHWQYPTSNGSCSNEIETAPARFNSTNYAMDVFPGQLTKLPIRTFDDINNTATNRTVYTASSLNSIIAQVDSTSRYISDNTIKLNGDPHDTETQISLYTLDPRVIYMTVNVTLRSCPPGLIPKTTNDRTTCECGGDYNGIVNCNQDQFQSKLKLQGAWLGYCGKHCSESKSSIIVAGYSPYTFHTKPDLPHHVQELNPHFCKHSNRQGTLCGECKPGYGPALNSHTFECTKCSEEDAKYHWVFFILSEILPVTIFFAILVLFNISLTSGPANAFIFFAQVITSSFELYTTSVSHYDIPRDVYTILYDIWNLNFFDPIIPSYCLKPGMKTATLISLNYVTAFYPLLFILVLFILLWVYNRFLKKHVHAGIRFDRCIPGCGRVRTFFRNIHGDWNLWKAFFNAVIAFLLLSYTKFTVISIRLLSFSYLYDDTGKHKGTVMFYDGTIGFFHTEHIPYVISAVIILLVFVVFPPLLLLFDPLKRLYHKLKQCIGLANNNNNADGKWILRLRHFIDAFCGCYKDDFHWFAGGYFILRIAFLSLSSINTSWALVYLLQQLLCTGAILLFTLLRPYQRDFYNYVDATMFAILAAISALSNYNYYLAETSSPSPVVFGFEYCLILCPLGYMSLYLLWYVVQKYKNCQNHIPENSDMEIMDAAQQRERGEEQHCLVEADQEEQNPERDVLAAAINSYGSTVYATVNTSFCDLGPRTSQQYYTAKTSQC